MGDLRIKLQAPVVDFTTVSLLAYDVKTSHCMHQIVDFTTV